MLEAFQPGSLDHLRATLPREVLEAVEGSARTDWIPVAMHGPYVAAIVRWLGEERAVQVWRRFASDRLIRSPAVRALAEGAVRVFGLSVRSFVRMVPLAFGQGFRDFGTMRLEHGDGGATLELVDIAPEVLPHFNDYAVLFHGVFLGIYDIVRAEPRLEYRADRAQRRISGHFRW